MVLVSKCLWGENCKYNGGNNLREDLKEHLKNEEVVLICPECEGGLPTPRLPSEIEHGKTAGDVLLGKGRVINSEGHDVTEEFVRGARNILQMAQILKPSAIYLKQGSPSCGCGEVYDGTFSGNIISGDGITARLLKDNGFYVIPKE